MNKINVSVSLDFEHDRELYAVLREQSEAPGSAFTVSGCSEHFNATAAWGDRARQRIRRADQVIIICGEHTDESIGVFTELQIAQEEQTPYFLLWGRRDRMCTKPAGAKSAEGMYSWTSDVIEDQLALIGRTVHREAIARSLKRPARPERPADGVQVP